MAKVKLLSSDSRLFELDERVARLMPLINSMFKDDQHPVQPIVIHGVPGDILDRVLHWVDHHQNDDQWDPFADEEDDYESGFSLPIEPFQYGRRGRRRPLRRTSSRLPLPEWDRAFLNSAQMDNCTLYALITAAHTLQIKRLRNLACTVVAHRLNQMNSNQLMAEFGVHRQAVNAARAPEEAQPSAPIDDEIHLLAIDQSRRGY